MKIRIFLLLFFVASHSFAQGVNDYKTVIVPLKFEFLKSDNQYRLATISKFNLVKAGFQVYYDNEPLSNENIERCSALDFDVIKEKSFLTTKLHIVFKDCFGKIIFQSETGVSKEKNFELAYKEALNKAFASIYALHYKYTEKSISLTPSSAVEGTAVPDDVPMGNVTAGESVSAENASSNILYAQPTAFGYQLVDSTPSVVMNLYRTSIKECYIAVKGNREGVLVTKGSQCFFEYYQNDALMSEKIEVKF